MESALRIQTDGKTPKYLQVIDSVKDAIRQGELKRAIIFIPLIISVTNT